MKVFKNENFNFIMGKYLDLWVKIMRMENILCNLNLNLLWEKGDRNFKLFIIFLICFSGFFIKKNVILIFRKLLGDIGE